ncbi:MAG: T9SS type A sorting domain-containing protein [Saprospiraceae bacterium]|nr:T9SS type A sorting domain-containing protein [Saprospiraceae bacterium]
MIKKITLLMILLISTIFSSYGQGTWSQSKLSTTAIRMGAASIGSKVYFAGGARGNNILPSAIVDIYDVNSKQWTTDNLAVARELTAGITNGNKIFFAGGINAITSKVFDDVDIYDTTSQQWSTANLSVPRFGIATASYGNEVLFAGGLDIQANRPYSTVDKFNTSTGVWSTDSLSAARGAMGYAVAGRKVVFAGGFTGFGNPPSNAVDIYDFNSGQWTTDTLSLARVFLSATAVGNKIIIAGGMTAANTPTDRVDIYDVSTGIWTTSRLSVPRALFDMAATACGKAFFVGGGNFNINTGGWETASNVVDIYDPVSGVWTLEQIPSHALVNHEVVANGNQLFVAGGTDLPTVFNTVDIYACSTLGIDNLSNEKNSFTLYPNPANEKVVISYPLLAGKNTTVTITDITGKLVFKTNPTQTEKIEVNTKHLDPGAYLVQVQTDDIVSARKLFIEK